MKLSGAITEGSGTTNEDGFGYAGSPNDIYAAWVLDGVTGINRQHLVAEGTDAQWFVKRVLAQLPELVARDLPLLQILEILVARLAADAAGLGKPPELYDPPAACLLLAKRYATGWQLLRLGDSVAVIADSAGRVSRHAHSPNHQLDAELTAAATSMRRTGQTDNTLIFQHFRSRVRSARSLRNQPEGYSILEANTAALAMAEIVALGFPKSLLLCSDGFYRAVDTYGLTDDQGLLAACGEVDGCAAMLARIRETEANDPGCLSYPRYKPADDATALMLSR